MNAAGTSQLTTRWDEQCEKLEEAQKSLLPNHECGDVAEWAECAAGVCRNHHIDTRRRDEAGAAAANRNHDSTEHQRRCEIVEHRREEEGHHARRPEERTERQSAGNQPRTKRRKQAALLQRVHIGHRREQKQQQLCIFEQIVTQEISRTFEAVLLPGEGDQYPSNGRRDDHGLRLAQLGKLFGDDEHISDYEHREGEQSEACPGQVGNCGIRCGERRQGSKQQQRSEARSFQVQSFFDTTNVVGLCARPSHTRRLDRILLGEYRYR